MADKLTKAFDDWVAKNSGDPDDFQIFQGGFTAGAVAMRERAVKAAQDHKDQNAAINAIGELPDVPEE